MDETNPTPFLVFSSLKRRGTSKGKTPSKSPLPKSPENTSDLEQDAINTYYAVRMDSKNGGSMANDGKGSFINDVTQVWGEAGGGVSAFVKPCIKV